MSMILLEPANKILYGSVEDQAADHLINGVIGNFNDWTCRNRAFARRLVGIQHEGCDTYVIHRPYDLASHNPIFLDRDDLLQRSHI